MDQSCTGEKCVFCSEEYASAEILRTHILKEHCEEKVKKTNFACDQPDCGRSYTRHSDLERHRQVHAGSTLTLICQLCGKTLSSKQQLSYHMFSQHTASKQSFSCKFCDKTFESKYLLGAHMKKFHPGKGTQKIKRERLIDPVDPGQDVLCRFCYKICANNWSLSIHMRQLHAEVPKSERILPDNSPKTYIKNESQCKFCSQKFDKKQFLGAHMRVRHPGQGRQARCKTYENFSKVEDSIIMKASPYQATAKMESEDEKRNESKCLTEEDSIEADQEDMPTDFDISDEIEGKIFTPVNEQRQQNELKNHIFGQIVSNNEDKDKVTSNLENEDEKRNEIKCVSEKDSIESDQEETEFDISDEIKEKIFAPVYEQSQLNELKNVTIGQTVPNIEDVAKCFETIKEHGEKKDREDNDVFSEAIETKVTAVKRELAKLLWNTGKSESLHCEEEKSNEKDSAKGTEENEICMDMVLKEEGATTEIALNTEIQNKGNQNIKPESKDKMGNISQCDECNFSCNRPSTLKDHKHVVHKGMVYKCESCDTSFTANRRLVEHTRMKHEPPLQCDKCNFSATRKIALTNHYIRDHSEAIEKREVHDKIHSCDECNFSCNRPYKLLAHKFTRHEGKDMLTKEEQATKDNAVNMEKLNKVNQILSKDGKRKVRIHFCEDCPFSCDRLDFLKDHKFTVHEGKMYECDQCEKTCKKTKNMKEHIKQKHGFEKETLLCELCNYHSKWARALKGHQKTKHHIL